MVPKVHLHMIDPHLDPPMGSRWSQSAKKGKIMAHSIKTILGRKVNLFNTYSDPIFGIFRNFLITEKTEKFL